jgi:hypothetical protein
MACGTEMRETVERNLIIFDHYSILSRQNPENQTTENQSPKPPLAIFKGRKLFKKIFWGLDLALRESFLARWSGGGISGQNPVDLS